MKKLWIALLLLSAVTIPSACTEYVPYYYRLASRQDIPQEIFLREELTKLSGRSCCLITNQAGLGRYLFWPAERATNLTRLHDIFEDAGSTLVEVFTPEHGLSAQEEEHGNQQPLSFLPKTIYKTKIEKMIEQYKPCDVIIFDLPDSGVRPYTYRSIITSSLRALHTADKQQTFLLIDTPNPASFVGIDGPVAQKHKFSVLGEEEIPHLPYYTYGELALYYKDKMQLKVDLRIQRLRNYRPGKHILTRPYFFNPPSPNLPHFRAVQCYWMMVLLEGSVIEEGRATKDPFCTFGHPDFDPTVLPPTVGGVSFEPFSFIAQSGKYKGKLLHGYRIEIENPEKYRPVEAAYELLRYLINRYPHISFLKQYMNQYYSLDELNGTDTLRIALQNNLPYAVWRKSEQEKIDRFAQEMKKYRLY